MVDIAILKPGITDMSGTENTDYIIINAEKIKKRVSNNISINYGPNQTSFVIHLSNVYHLFTFQKAYISKEQHDALEYAIVKWPTLASKVSLIYWSDGVDPLQIYRNTAYTSIKGVINDFNINYYAPSIYELSSLVFKEAFS